MQGLKSDTRRKNLGASVLAALKLPIKEPRDIHRMLVGCGEECAASTLKLRELLGLSDFDESLALKNIIDSGACYRLSDMKIRGGDLLTLGIRGEQVGKILNELLYLIADGEISNDKEELILYAKRKITE